MTRNWPIWRSTVSSERSEDAPIRPPLRSLLFIPGTKTEWLPKAEKAGADAVVFDLEDAVPSHDKASALDRVTAVIRQAARMTPRTAVFVRTNPLDCWASAEEVRAVVGPGLAGIVVPKVDSAHHVQLADQLLTWCERERGLPDGTVALMPVLETARSLRDAYAIASASRRVAYLGAVTGSGGDVARAVGYRWSPEGTETLALRSRVLLDVRAAGSPNPVAGLWTRVSDLEGLRGFAEQNRSLGYEGMVAIHPSHVPVINAVFSPSADELVRYQRLVAALEHAQANEQGAVSFEGEMIDEAMAETARQILRRYVPNSL
jgi:citrate lyase subunit beta / citryl-CoA lyase